MKTWGKILVLFCAIVFFSIPSPAATLYVDANSIDPEVPYNDWSTAAVTIQDAVDAASDGDLVLVNDGIYNTGGALAIGDITNRVAVTKQIIVQSVNGAAVTVIEGYQVPGVTNDDAAIRCVYLTNGASLIGFTLTNGATRASNWYSQDWYYNQSGGGVWCEPSGATVSSCIIIGNAAGDAGAGGIGGTFSNCTFINNYAYDVGGGVYNSVLDRCFLCGNTALWGGGGSFASTYLNVAVTASDCIFSNNASAYYGGGAMGGELQRCTLINNFCTDTLYGDSYGGGASQCTLSDCTLTGNTADYGGGAESANLEDCIVTNNSAVYGGGLWSNITNGFMADCIVASNVASYGGGAYQMTLYNCTLVDNLSTNSGGAASQCVLNNCRLINNSAAFGAGARSSTLVGCLVISNTASSYGGGALSSSLTNCTVVANAASAGGGISSCSAHNSILFDNVNGNGETDNYADNVVANGASSFAFSCTTPLPDGPGNFTNDPVFIDFVHGDFHLQTNSPCINSGNNHYNSLSNDLDGNPRIAGGTIDMGAFEFQSPGSIISYAWLMQYGLPLDGSADFQDPDADGMNNWEEWIAGTDPTSASSLLQMISAIPATDFGSVTVTWKSVSGKTYYLERSGDLSTGFSTIQSNLVGQAGSTGFTDVTAGGDGPYFYRVTVQQ